MKSETDPSTNLADEMQATAQIAASQITDDLKQHLPGTLEPYPVVLAYLYGSVAEGRPTPLSDVDIALVLASETSLNAYQRFMMELDIEAELERRFGIPDTDVRSINDAPLRVQGTVITRGKLLYSADDDFRAAFEGNTRKRYFDLQPILAENREAYFARIGSDSGDDKQLKVQPETIEGIFRNLDIFLGQLRQLAEVPEEELVDDLVELGAAKYYLQVSIECCIDTANHIISRQGFRPPKSYADSFSVLAENGVIDEDFAAIGRQMAKMRNRLVHLYWEIDADIIHGVLRNNLGDFERFKRYVYSYMRGLQSKSE
ncbi:MAG: hypothetical protein MAG451_02338 [Anaerolineales bacterium]|nr:hypothetical protein [Anaerolineales bacterium]